MLLEREMNKQNQQTESPEGNTIENREETSTEDLKKDIRLCLEDELTNLEEERLELEETEQLLIEQEVADTVGDEFTDGHEHSAQLQEIREEISQRKQSAHNKKKVLERFKHVFDNEELDQSPGNKIKVGSIREKLEVFLQNSELESKKQFEDNVLTGVAEVMSKVKNRLETQPEVAPVLYSKKEIKRKRNDTALKFETTTNDQDTMAIKSEKEWAWKNKSPIALENILLTKYKEKSDPSPEKPRKHFQDIKYEELLEDIQAVKERMKERNIVKESEERNEEMKLFMAEMQGYLTEKENTNICDEDEDGWEDDITYDLTPREPERKLNKLNNISWDSNFKLDKLPDYNTDKSPKLLSSSKLIRDVKKKFFENELLHNKNVDHENLHPVPKPIAKSLSGLVPRIAELLQPEEHTQELMKAPKLLLKTTSIENEEERPIKTLEELKTEQQSKKWSYKEKSIKDLQDFIQSNDNIAPELFKQQQKTLQDLDDELDIVTNLITSNNTDIIVQIQEEKEKEFTNFMNEVKSYVNSNEKKDKDEEEFRIKIKSYLDLIDTPSEDVKTLSFPELNLNRINKVKKQLFEMSLAESDEKKTVSAIKKLDKALFNSPIQESKGITVDKKNIEVTKTNILSIKDIYEQNKTEPDSPRIIPRKDLPAIEKLKSRGQNKIECLKFQLANKLKTIHECLEYVEDNESFASPKIIELIHNLKVARKEEDKVNIYNKFIESVHTFIEQSSRSEEQKIFKENIKAYLEIIENSDPLLNGTPKLKKHTACSSVISSNNKKDQIEKDSKNSTASQGFSSGKEVLSPDEKRKEIFAKYGLKDRARNLSDENSNNSCVEENMEDIKKLTDKELCLKYGLPELCLPEEPKPELKSSSNSLINLISKIRNTSVSRASSKEATQLPYNEAQEIQGPSNKEILNEGVTMKMKNMFEQITNFESPQITRETVPRSDFSRKENCLRILDKLDSAGASPKIPTKFLALQKSSTISNIGNFFTESINEKPSPKCVRMPVVDSTKFNEKNHVIERSPSVPLERSSSFAKVKNAFENGVGLNEESDDDSDCDNYLQNNVIATELQALKRDNKIQNMFRICRSDSDASKSPKLSRALDQSTLKQVARSKSAITSMFESQGPKITYGGSKPQVEAKSTIKKTEKVKSTPLDNRKWVFDTIQKYFDVIVEEDQEVENATLGPMKDNGKDEENDDDIESDYTSAEEGVPSPFCPRVTVSDKFNLQSYFTKSPERRSSSVTGQPIRKVSIDEFVADAAKQFDELAVDSDLNLKEPDCTVSSTKIQRRPHLTSSCQNVNQLSKSGMYIQYTHN